MMLVAIICAILAIACLTQGAVEGAIALGVIAAVCFFLLGSELRGRGFQWQCSKGSFPLAMIKYFNPFFKEKHSAWQLSIANFINPMLR